MDRESPYTGNIGCLQCPEHGIFEKAGTKAFSLPVCCNRETSQQHDGDGVPGEALLQTLQRAIIFHLTADQGVVSGDFRICHRNVCLRSAGLLVLERVSDEPSNA